MTRIRNGRLVLFGGSDGHDLLRSGMDFSDIWELNLHLDWSVLVSGSGGSSSCCIADTTTTSSSNVLLGRLTDDFSALQRTFPWSWNDLTMIHFCADDDYYDDEPQHANIPESDGTTSPGATMTQLHPSEQLAASHSRYVATW
jgi:hypothetical protein